MTTPLAEARARATKSNVNRYLLTPSVIIREAMRIANGRVGKFVLPMDFSDFLLGLDDYSDLILAPAFENIVPGEWEIPKSLISEESSCYDGSLSISGRLCLYRGKLLIDIKTCP
jgi:hypothetical protein